VWIVLETYFVVVAVKGLWQVRSTLRPAQEGEHAAAIG
jgi:hypothetical protein